jgi:hypothetical protein
LTFEEISAADGVVLTSFNKGIGEYPYRPYRMEKSVVGGYGD